MYQTLEDVSLQDQARLIMHKLLALERSLPGYKQSILELQRKLRLKDEEMARLKLKVKALGLDHLLDG
jgi:hypothetical protein